MQIELEESTYQSGPDDTLRVVDIYGEGEIFEAFEAASETTFEEAESEDELELVPAPEEVEKEKEAALQNLKSAMATGSGDITSEQLLSLGITDQQIKGFVPVSLPNSVSAKEVLTNNPSMGVNEVTETLKAIKRNVKPSEYVAMSNADVQSAIQNNVNTITGLERGILGDGTEMDKVGITPADTRLQKLQKINGAAQTSPVNTKVKQLAELASVDTKHAESGDEVLAEVEAAEANGDISAKEALHVKREITQSAAQNGNSKVTGEIVDKIKEDVTPWWRRQTLKSLLKNFRLDDKIPKNQFGGLANRYIKDLDKVDPKAFINTRNGIPSKYISILKYGSEGSLELLGYNVDFKEVTRYIQRYKPEGEKVLRSIAGTTSMINNDEESNA